MRSPIHLCLLLIFGVTSWLSATLAADDRSSGPASTEDVSSERPASPQGRRRNGIEGMFRLRIEPHWIRGNDSFWYRNELGDGVREFVLVDCVQGKRELAFDHQQLAESLAKVSETEMDADRLPFEEIAFSSVPSNVDEVFFRWQDAWWSYHRTKRTCERLAAEDERIPTRSGQPETEGETRRRRRGNNASAWIGRFLGVVSPDQKWRAMVRDGNIFLSRVTLPNADQDVDENPSQEDSPAADAEATGLKSDTPVEYQLTEDGNADASYQLLNWSPNSQTLVGFRHEPGENKLVYRLESSPGDGGRAVLHQRPYALPGDKLSQYHLVLFDAATQKTIPVNVDPIVMEWGRPSIVWCSDGRDFLFYQVDRGHQRLRIQRVNGATGEVRMIFDEVTDTFIWTAHTENLKLDLVNWLPESDEVIYVSERDGWRHLYLLDAAQGGIKAQMTSGEYVVRGIDRIDTDARQVWFHASGKNVGQDPYLLHYYRVDFDGSNLVALTEGNGDHRISLSPDRRFLIDTYSRVDTPPVHTLRSATDGRFLCELERADLSGMQADDFAPVEPFVAKGRDGVTDIWGVICRPSDFDPKRRYPVVEAIYAGPQGSFVPKSFRLGNPYARLANLGFIVVQIDGMGTANRSKAFHDVCWHNLKDAGFPDRILWMKEAAKKYPQMDLNRVGIYGGSAGGQNAAAALLFHHDFYKVAVAGCGCHDNRMDKASWNEQWMGYPVGPQYSACSNIDNAHRLQGKLMLILGEMDDNVPPESTLRLVDALVKADKDFEFIFVPGAGHGMGGSYGDRRMRDFLVKHLLTDADKRNESDETETSGDTGESASEQVRAAAPEEETSPAQILATASPVNRIIALSDRYQADLGSLRNFYRPSSAPQSRRRVRELTLGWLDRLAQIKPETLAELERTRLAEFRARLYEVLARQVEAETAEQRLAAWLPHATALHELAEARWEIRPIDAAVTAQTIDDMAAAIEQCGRAVKEAPTEGDLETMTASDWQTLSARVAQHRRYLRDWNKFYDGYDPAFSWWVRQPYQRLDEAFAAYQEAIKGHLEADADVTTTEAQAVEHSAASPSHENHGGDVPGLGYFARTIAEIPDVPAMMQRPRGKMEGVLMQFLEEQEGRRRLRSAVAELSLQRENLQTARASTGDEATNQSEATSEDSAAGETARDRLERRSAERRRQWEEYQLGRWKAWLDALEATDFEALVQADRVDCLLLKNHLRSQIARAERRARERAEAETRQSNDAEASDQTEPKSDREPRRIPEEWQPTPPIGHDGLMAELAREMISYTPEQLVKIAEAEYRWCRQELFRAASEMGYGEDWQAAVEHVKRMHVQPGEQPRLIRQLADEAIDFLRAHDLVSVPTIAAETWAMQMMSPERQLVNPFFTGGSEISVSFPTDTMTHDAKLRSLRGNNIPFARATVQHELIPGHNLQAFVASRYHPERRLFSTPFWTEGWALYWEMRLYELGFPKTPEDRVGFLVWRSHRCARIIFSLSYHLGTMTPEECIDFLVANVGFERRNATAEVRRSFEGGYSPLYQAAYMLGGLQFRQLHQELVASGRMTEREFHDAILAEGNMPVVMVRALLTGTDLCREGAPDWYFYGMVGDQP